MRSVAMFLMSVMLSGGAAAQSAVTVQPSVAADPATHASGPAQTESPVAAVRAVLILRTSFGSKNTAVGKEVKATLKQPITLPNGPALPRGSSFLGSVVAVSKRSKERPNGVVVITFDHVALKGNDPMPVIVKLMGLAASEDDQKAVTLPNSNGNMATLSGNSGGVQQIIGAANDQTSLKGKTQNSSSIPGVYLAATPQGSGALFALGEDVYVDPDIQLNVLIATPLPQGR